MSQKDITLRQGHATPATIILRALEAAPPSPTTTIYLYEFHPTPSTVVLGDPTTVRVSGDPTPVTYEFTGNVALTFGVASPLAVTYAEPSEVTLTLGVSSPSQFVITSSEPEITGGTRMTLRWKPKPVVFEFEGAVAFRLGVASRHSVSHVPPAGIVLSRVTPRSPRQFVTVPSPLEPLSEADQLVLAGVL